MVAQVWAGERKTLSDGPAAARGRERGSRVLLREVETDAPLTPAPRPLFKPRLRGWSHAAAAAGALAFTILIGWLSRPDTLRFWVMLVFGISNSALYIVSAVYHLGGPRPLARHRRLRTLDHCGIFVGIAGSYTPFCFLVPSSGLRTALLVGIWLGAMAGIGLKIAQPWMSRGLSTSLYVATGWIGLIVLPSIWAVLPTPAGVLLLCGGLLFTLGAVVYGWRRPDPLPRLFGYHEVFHLLVVGGSATVSVVLLLWVAPLLA
jgi:hemolysin III